MSDDVVINVTVHNQTTAGFQSIKRNVGDLRASLLSLAPAAVPVAAALVPIAARAGAAAVAVGAFGAAVVPQIANLSDAAKAQDKYSQAVQQYGANSKQAVAAQQQAAQVLAGMPKATQQAAAAYSNLRDQFKGFSDSTAKFTMVPVEHSFAVLGQIIPKLTPMVQATSTQLDRLMKVAGGAVNTRGFDALSKRVSDFANQSLKDATDKAIHFMRVMSEGNASGPLTEFMAYAKQQGPAVKELLSNLVSALGNIAQGAAEAGPGMLTIVNAFAKLVAAVPSGLIGNLMQVYAAFKLIKLAGAGIAAGWQGMVRLTAAVQGLRTASAAASGGLAGLRAAFMSLGTAAKATVVVAGITALVLVMQKLSSIGKQAPPDVDRMATSVANLGRTGKVSGEALRVFGKDLGGLADSLRTLSRPSNLDKTQQFLTSLIGMDSTPVKEAKENLDSVDKALAGLVKGGKADLAKAAFDDVAKAMEKQGMSGKELKGQLDDYKSALADAALEAKLTAESQGLFGAQAQKTQAALDAQKASADGLRQSIQALNDVNRSGLGGMIGFEAAIDAAAKAAKDNAGALSMTNGVLNLNGEKARNAAGALQDLADKTDSAAASARESGSSWETVNGIYSRGRSQLIKTAQQMGLTGAQAAQLADQILKIPNKTARVKMNTEDAKAGLNSFNAAVKRTPGSKSVTLKTLSKGAEQALESFGFKVTRLPNGKVKVSAATGSALSGIGNVAGLLAKLNGQVANVYTKHHIQTFYEYKGKSISEWSAGRMATGGVVRGPGTDTSDSVPIMASNDEFVVNARSSRKHRGLLRAINEDRMPRFARGGSVSKAERQARRDARGDLTVSHFGRMAGYSRSEFGAALGKPDSIGALVSALGQWRGIIMKATHGGTESKLLKQLDSTAKGLLKYEKQLNSVTKNLEKARDKLSSLKDAASSLAGSVKSGILGSSNITRGASGDSPVTVASVMGGLTQSRDKATAFSSALARLKKKGLSASLIKQIAEAGIEGGGLETAGALLEASGSEIKSLNDMQGQIGKAAKSAGKTTADAVYGKAIREQTKAVAKLERSQDKLRHSMEKLARSMEKSLEKAFKGKAAGGIVGAATGGIRGGLTWVGEHEPELLQLPAGSRVWSGPDSRRKAHELAAPWASMLNPPRRGSSSGAAPAVSGRPDPVVIELRSSGSEVDEFLLKILRRAINVRGGNAQVVLTGRR